MADRTCLLCDRTELVARGLCHRCWQNENYHGRLDQWRPRPTRPGAALGRTAADHGITATTILGPSRDPAVTAARTDAAHRLRTDCQMSLPAIGKALDRHHTTIMALLDQPQPDPPNDPPALPDEDRCHVPGCDRPFRSGHATLGWCSGHYMRWTRGGLDPDRPLRPVRPADAPVLDLERHDRSGYRNGCRCETCLADATKAVKLNRHRPATTDTAEVVAHIRRLVDAGMNRHQIAVAAGVNSQQVYAWVKGRRRALRSNVEAVLAVEPPAPPAPSVPSCEDCDRPSLAGGRWCLPHLREHAQGDRRRVA